MPVILGASISNTSKITPFWQVATLAVVPKLQPDGKAKKSPGDAEGFLFLNIEKKNRFSLL